MIVGFFGDWHENGAYAETMLERVMGGQHGDVPHVLVHLGDFGFFPGAKGRRYLETVDAALRAHDRDLYVVDGNHDDHVTLFEADETPDPDGFVTVFNRIKHVPRGHRWEWGGVSFLGLGGAISLDREWRTLWVDYWPQEAITMGQAARVALGGRADVMVCHDAPTCVDVPNIPPKEMWPVVPMRDADQNRWLLQRVIEQVTPRIFVHGHFHSNYCKLVDGTWYIGLDCDGKPFDDNYWWLDTDVLAAELATQQEEGTT